MARSKQLIGTALFFVALAVLAPAKAFAINNTCANREAMLVGSTENWSIAASSSAFFATRLQAGRSYIVLAWTPFEDAGEGGGGVALNVWSDIVCTTAATGVTSVESREPWFNVGAADIDAVSIIPSASGQYVLEVANLETRSVSHRIIIFETSIYSPWWFAAGSNQSFVTVSNRSSSTNSVTVTMNSSTGAQCGTTTFNIPANGNSFVRVNDYAACVTAGFGSAQIAFVGPPGSIQANTTVLDVVQGVSFDEPFIPRMEWSITER
jgi:hypothetical protein